MTDAELSDIRRNYEKSIEQKKEVLDLEEAIELYEQLPVIQRYLTLKRRLEYISPSTKVQLLDEEILERIIDDIGVSNTNNIYVCMGAYKFNPDKNVDVPSDFIVQLNDPNADYIEYVGIEKSEFNPQFIKLPSKQRVEFEKDNIVLYPPDEVNSTVFFNKIREMFFKIVIKDGQEKALEKILEERRMQENSSTI